MCMNSIFLQSANQNATYNESTKYLTIPIDEMIHIIYIHENTFDQIQTQAIDGSFTACFISPDHNQTESVGYKRVRNVTFIFGRGQRL